MKRNNFLHDYLVILLMLFIITIAITSCTKKEMSPEDARNKLAELKIQYNENSFFDAIYNNDKLIVDLFLKAGMNPNTVFSGKQSGITPLIVSVMQNNIEFVTTFLNKGADINYKFILRDNEYNVLFLSITSLNVEMTKFILNNNANTIFKIGGKNITAAHWINELLANKRFLRYPEASEMVMDNVTEQNANKIRDILDDSRIIGSTIDAGKAMRYIYDNYDQKTGESIWTETKLNLAIVNWLHSSLRNNNKKPFDKNKFKIVIKDNFSVVRKVLGGYLESANDKYLLITEVTPYGKDYTCHACAPLISGFVFSKKENGWWLDVADYFIDFYGQWGEACNGKIIKLGPTKFGVIFEDVFSGQGCEESVGIIIAPIGNKFQKIIELDLGGNNEGRTLDDNKYYNYKAKYELINHHNKDFYDLKVTTSGTINKNDKVAPINEEVIYSFKNNKYIKNNN